MAKTPRKGSKYEMDDYGFSNDLDIPDFGVKDPSSKDDRKPVTKFAKGFASGAKDAATSPQFVTKVMRNALPKGYGNALDFADETAGSLRSLYDNASKEIAPAVDDMKRFTERVMPKTQKFLPKSVAERIKKWAGNRSDSKGMSLESQRDSAMSMQMAEIFGTQMEQDAKRDAQNDAKDKLKEGLSQARHRDQIGQLDALRRAAMQTNAYTIGPNAKFQRKSLELQFRQYFAMKDLLEEQRRFNATAQQQLLDIKKNTGLPDFVKLNYKEAFDQAMRNKFVGFLGDSIFERRAAFAKKMMSNLGQLVMGKVRTVSSGIQQSVSMANMGADMMESMSGFVDPHEMAGHLAGNAATMGAGGWLGRKLLPWMLKHKGIVKMGNKLDHGLGNMPQLARQWANKPEDFTQEKSGPRRWMEGFLKDWINQSLGGQNNKIEKDTAGDMYKPSPFTRQAHKSLTEIIPGFLSRIYRELQVMRTGNENIELTTFDYHKGRFSSSTKARKNAIAQMVGGFGGKATQEQLNGFIDKIAGNTKLTAEQRKELSLKLLRDNHAGEYGGVSRLGDAKAFGNSKHAELYASLFRNHVGTDSLGVRNNALTSEYNKLGNWLNDARFKMQQHANLGGAGDLAHAKLIDPATGEINTEQLFKYQLGHESYEPGKSPRRGIPGHARGGLFGGGATLVGEEGAELKVTGPARFYSKHETEEMLRKGGVKSTRTTLVDTVKEIAATIHRIEEQLHVGVPSFHAGPWMAGMRGKLSAHLSKLRGRGQDMAGRMRERTKGLHMTLGDLGKNLWKGASGLGSGAWSMSTGLFKSGVTSASWLGNKAYQWGTTGGKGLYEHWRDKADVFVKGEITPRITEWKLKLGAYKDQATGKVIKSLKDIQGNIVDENGKVVLTMEEAKKAFIRTGLGTKLLSGLTKLKDAATGALGWVGGKFPSAVGMVAAAAKKSWDFLVNHPQDVYVKGEKEPKLLATIMGNKGYFSKSTSKPIDHPGQIDGPVVFADGNEALTAADIQKGLVDRFGLPLRTRLSRLFGAGLAASQFLVRKMMAAGKWVGGLIKGGIGKAVRGLGNLTQGVFPGLSGWGFGGGTDGEQTVGLLTQIRDLLDDRLPGGGLFGGGGRSPLDVDLGQLEHEGKGVGKAEQAAAKGGRFSRWGSALKGSRAGRLMGGAASVARTSRLGQLAGRAAGAAKASRLAGWGGRGLMAAKGLASTGWSKVAGKASGLLGSVGGKALGWGLKGLGLAGTAYGAYSAYDDFKHGNYGSAAMDAGLAGLGLVETGVTMGGLATAAGVAGTGLAALVASPVLLGALAVGAVAGAGYLGYKAFTRKSLGQLSKLRYAQYGFAEKDSDHLQTVFGLEDRLKDALKWGITGPQLDGSKVDVKKVLDDFGVSDRQPQQMQRWTNWFQNRFKPVFLTHVAALRSVDPKKWLSDVDGLKGADKKRYFNLSKFDNGPYGYTDSPFDTKPLAMDSSAVAALSASIAADLAKEKEDDKKPGTPPVPTTAAAAAGAKAAAAGAAGAAAATKTMGNGPTQPGMPPQQGGTTTSAAASYTGFGRAGNGQVDALTVIRYKTYGLQEMVTEKTRALDQLEAEVVKGLSFASKAMAKWNGSVDDLLTAVGPAFGVSGVANDAAYDWKSWFNTRFLPTFLNFATAMAQATGRTSLTPEAYRNLAAGLTQTLKGNEAVDVATAVYTTPGVWNQSSSPWPGYTLNTEVRSIEANFAALKELAKKNVKKEQVGSAQSTGSGVGKDNGVGVTNGTKPGVVSKAWEATKSAASSVWQSVRSVGSAVGTGLYNATHTDPNVQLATGGPARQLGDMGTGQYADLPEPKGSGKWQYFQDLFEKVAKIVGVDPHLMASMAAIESGFNPTIKAGSSSATGLFQFISDTWRTMLRKWGPKFGIPMNTPPTDARANALLGAAYIRENMQAIKGVKPEVSDTDVYMAHFLGAGGAKTFFKANPGDIAAQVLPGAARANTSIFYNRDSSPRTVAEVYAEMNRRLSSRGKQFGLQAGGGSLPTSTAGAGRGSVNPAAADPNAVGPTNDSGAGAGRGKINPSIPVSDQAPAPAVNTTPAPVDSNASAAGAAGVSDTGTSGAGASSPAMARAQNTQQVQQAQRDDMAKSLGALNDVGTQQLATQNQMLLALRSIEDLVRKRFGTDATSDAQAPQGQSAAPKFVQKMPTAPVSMSKVNPAW